MEKFLNKKKNQLALVRRSSDRVLVIKPLLEGFGFNPFPFPDHQNERTVLVVHDVAETVDADAAPSRSLKR